MLAIRLRRTGSKKRPFFRVIVTDSRTARDSSFVEVLGSYNPRTNPETLKINRERLEHWVKTGAVPSDTVRTLVDRMPLERPRVRLELAQHEPGDVPELVAEVARVHELRVGQLGVHAGRRVGDEREP